MSRVVSPRHAKSIELKVRRTRNYGNDTNAMFDVVLIFSCVDACRGSPAAVKEWLKMGVAC